MVGARGLMEPYYSDPNTTIWHGDCREILPAIDLAPVDLVLTDPPYNVGKDYDVYDDDRPPPEYESWCREWWALCREAAPRAIVFPGHGNLGMWLTIEKPAAIGCWYKPGNGAKSIIGFEEWEPWLYWHGGNGGLLGGSSVVRAPIDTSGNLWAIRAGHPCPKPTALMSKLLTKSRALTVLDPFMGSGTTLRAAKNLGRHAVGIEISERYCEIAANRLAQEVLPL